MNKTTTAEMTVLFADVAGSVQLYDLIGDVQAHQKIVDCLKRMTEIVEKVGGVWLRSSATN